MILILGFSSIAGLAQEESSIEQIIGYYYSAVSGPSGKRDWERLKSICLESAKFNAVGITAQGTNVFHPQTLKEYCQHMDSYITKFGFYQTEIYYEIKLYSSIAHVFSTYESRNTPKGDIMDRGVFSFQLIKTDTEWKIANIMWNSETSASPIPDKFFGK